MRVFLRRHCECSHCERTMHAGTAAHRQAKQYRCLNCGPWPTPNFPITRLPPAAAEGAYESQRPMGTRRQTGLGRNRLPSAARRARQRRLNTAD